LPIVSIDLADAEEAIQQSGYIREAVLDNQLATAQVAAHVLGLYGEVIAQQHLAKWFDVFNYHYQKSVCQPNKGNSMSLEHYLTFLDVSY
jgi:DTW domain-containing protein YfiP